MRELVWHLQGIKAPKRPLVRARLQQAVQPPFGYRFYVRVRLAEKNGAYTAEPLLFEQRSARCAQDCNALLTVPADCKGYAAGAEVCVALIDDLL